MDLQSKPLIASKESMKYHFKYCPYAQNIKASENGIWFDFTFEAEKFGFTQCRCLATYSDVRYEDVEAPTVMTENSFDESHLKEKFLVLQHFTDYVDPVGAVVSQTIRALA